MRPLLSKHNNRALVFKLSAYEKLTLSVQKHDSADAENRLKFINVKRKKGVI